MVSKHLSNMGHLVHLQYHLKKNLCIWKQIFVKCKLLNLRVILTNLKG